MNDLKKPTQQSSLWLSNIKNLLDRTGFSEIWKYPNSVRIESLIPLFKHRLIDNFIVELRIGIESSNSMTLYREINDNFEIQSYLSKVHNRKQRQALSKLRLSSHGLRIETGRHIRMGRENRKCTLCDSNDIEDEFHFILKCPVYNDVRAAYIKRYC